MLQSYDNIKNFTPAAFLNGSFFLLLFCILTLSGCGENQVSAPPGSHQSLGETAAGSVPDAIKNASEARRSVPDTPVQKADSGILLPLSGSCKNRSENDLIDFRNPFLPPLAYLKQKNLTAKKAVTTDPASSGNPRPYTSFSTLSTSFPQTGHGFRQTAKHSAVPCLTGILSCKNTALALLSWGENSGVFAQGEVLKNGYRIDAFTDRAVVLHKSRSRTQAADPSSAVQQLPEQLTLHLKEGSVL